MTTNTSVSFTVDNQKLQATIFYPPDVQEKNPAVLFIHGWKSNRKNYVKRAEAVANTGAICLTFDLRGHGESEGDITKLSRQDHLADVLAAYDFLLSQQGVDPERIGVCGISYGGYLATLLTQQRKVKWLALRVPALYPDTQFSAPTATLIEKDPKFFSQKQLTPANSSALKAVSEFTGDKLLVASENDSLISPETIQAYRDAASSKGRLTFQEMKGADHQLSTQKMEEEFVRILSDWFEKQNT